MRYIYNKIENFSTQKLLILVSLFVFIPKIIYTFQISYIGIVSDEVSTLSSGALLAGYDWSMVVSNAGYYGPGMISLFYPLFYLVKDPIILYHILLICVSILQSSQAFLCFDILKNHLKLKSNTLIILFSVLSSYIVTRRGVNITNEHMLIFLTWVIVYLIFKLMDSESKSNIYKSGISILLSFILCYSFTVHTRSITYLYAFLIIFVLYFLLKRKLLVKIIPFIISFAIFYFFSQYFIEFIKNNNTILENGLMIRNSYVPSVNLSNLLNPIYWKSFIFIIVGQISTMSVFSGGIAILGGVLTIF